MSLRHFIHLASFLFPLGICAGDLTIRANVEIADYSIELVSHSSDGKRYVPSLLEDKWVKFNDVQPGRYWLLIQDAYSSWDTSYLDAVDLTVGSGVADISIALSTFGLRLILTTKDVPGEAALILAQRRSAAGSQDPFRRWILIKRSAVGQIAGKAGTFSTGSYLFTVHDYDSKEGKGRVLFTREVEITESLLKAGSLRLERSEPPEPTKAR